MEFELAIDTAYLYGIEQNRATDIVSNIKSIVGDNWQALAKKYGISRGEIERMRPAFQQCER